MAETTFIPGFTTEAKARSAGRKFFAKTNGKPGVYAVDFHIVKNGHGRWHFEPGRSALAKATTGETTDV